MRLNLLAERQRAPQWRDVDSVDAMIDDVPTSTVAGPCYLLELNSEPNAAGRVVWHLEDEFRTTPIARRLVGEWGTGRLTVVGEHDQRSPMFLASYIREGAAMRLLNAEGRLIAYLCLNTSLVIQPLQFPADPNVVRAVVAECYLREPERVLEFVPCRAWRDATTGELIPIRGSLLPYSGRVFYIADGELFPCCEAVVVKPQEILFTVFTGYELLEYRLTQHQVEGIIELLRRARG